MLQLQHWNALFEEFVEIPGTSVVTATIYVQLGVSQFKVDFLFRFYCFTMYIIYSFSRNICTSLQNNLHASASPWNQNLNTDLWKCECCSVKDSFFSGLQKHAQVFLFHNGISLSKYITFSLKLTFLTPRYVHILVLSLGKKC